MQSGASGKTPEALYGCAVRSLSPKEAAPQTVSPCAVCGGTSATPRYAVEGVDAPVVVCETCGLGRFHPMLSTAQVAAFYPDEYYGEPYGEPGAKFHPVVERVVRWIGARHVSFLTGGLPPRARVLDVGCGRGVVLSALADRGYEVHGVELSAEAARGADPRAEVRITACLADAEYPAASFDEVLVWHVLEHLPDPRETLQEVHRILRPGGRLIVAVPNFSSLQARCAGPAWFHLDLPRHLYQFPISALRRLLEATGFEALSDHHFSLRQNPFGWIQSAQNLVPGLPRNGLYALLQHRGEGPLPFGRGMRALLLASFAVLAPFALAALVAETALRSGATVHIVARRRPDPVAPHASTTPASSRA